MANFDINLLNGVQFTAAQTGYVAGLDTGRMGSATGGLKGTQAWDIETNSPPGSYTYTGPLSMFGAADGINAGYGLSGFGTVDPGAITVISTAYLAGGIDGNYYRPPTFGTIKFASSSRIFEVRGFGEDGRSIILSLGDAGSSYSGSSALGIMGDGGIILSLDTLPVFTYADPPSNVPYGFGNDQGDIDAFTTGLAALCFAEGTRIDTPEGPVAVEDLVEGQQVRTASGAVRPIRWIGQMLSRPDRHPRPAEVQPVRVAPHAFGPGMPAQDVRLSPGHAVFVDGVLVPVGTIVNGATIVQEAVTQIRYFHIELDSHDVLLAEGLPCESYLDDGNRATFANAGAFTDLHGRLDPKSWDDACAPLVAAGPQLTALQQRLHARAEALGWVRSEAADLLIEVDGVQIAPAHAAGNRFWFAVPAAEALTLRSNHGVLAHLVPGLGDGRMLGVAVAELRIDGVGIDLDDAAFGTGFYPVERHEALGWRWTDGAAVLSQALPAPAMVEVALAMVAPSWVRPAPMLRVVA